MTLDSGAHRFHDKDSAATDTVKDLLGEGLQRTDAPSRIYSESNLVDFPLSPLGLIKSLGVIGFARSTYEIARSRWANGDEPDHDLKRYATRTYGSAIAGRFLLNYSEKLWGTTPEKLSSGMAKTRLRGLSVQGFPKEAVLGTKAKTEHLDGCFYYPERGIGEIADALGEAIGSGRIRKRSRVTKVMHDRSRIRSITLNGTDSVDVDEVISTIPLPRFLEMMHPWPAEDILARARELRYRNLILVAFFLRKSSVTPNGTIYFPEKDFVFTRAYEPKNRGRLMSRPGQTSLVLEVPCDPGDTYWNMPDGQLIQLVLSHLSETGWVKPNEIIDTQVKRMEEAYPVVGVDTGGMTEEILGFLDEFANLRIAGRNGRFVYCSILDLMRESREIAWAYGAGAAEISGVSDLSAG